MNKFIDLTNKKFGRLTVFSMAESKDRRIRWKCRCDCGNIVEKRTDYLKNSPNPSCGCWTRERKTELATNDLTGKRFNALTVIEFVEIKNSQSYWRCKCDCGNVSVFPSKGIKERKSCGCIKGGAKYGDITYFKHMKSGHPAYHIWCGMMARCFNESCREYKHYGERGITVCEEWKDVKLFCRWAEVSGYKKGLTIERKDVNGNYCPDNCCWIPQNEQSWNRRDTIFFDYMGDVVSLAKICKKLNLNLSTVRDRWYRGIRDTERLLYNGDLRDLRKEEKIGMGS